MRIALVSDLHLEILNRGCPPGVDQWSVQAADVLDLDAVANADVAVFAGDIDASKKLGASIRHLRPSGPVVAIAGNHEHYGRPIRSSLIDCRVTCEEHDVHFLEQDTVTIDDVRFVGCTLWTDYAFYDDPWEGMRHAAMGVRDHRQIRAGDGDERFTPQRARDIHLASRRWLVGELAQPFDGKTVVVTHHAPTALSVHERFHGDEINGSFVSHLEPMIREYAPDFWLHGHVHDAVHAEVGTTTVIANPRGYPGETGQNGYRPNLIIDTNTGAVTGDLAQPQIRNMR